MAKRILILVFSLCLILSSGTDVALAYYETDPELEYIRVAEKLDKQFDFELGSSGSQYFTGGEDRAITDVPGFVGLIYTKTETGKGYGNTENLINDVYLLIAARFPFEFDGVSVSGKIDSSNRILNLNVETQMLSTFEFREADILARSVAEEIKTQTESKREMVELANLYLIDHVVYPKFVDQNKSYLWNAYGALVKGEAVCQGYAAAFNLLMQHLGIPVVNDYGNSDSEPHVWNQVRIDGEWFYVDVTFNDPVTTGGRITSTMKDKWSREFLLLTEEEFFDKEQHEAVYRKYSDAAKEVFFRNDLINEADELKKSDLFYGDSGGYRLEDGLTRAEMAVMLARVIGASFEIESNKAEYAGLCPFSDVPEWAKAYIGYCVSQNLIKGIGNNLYGSNLPASKLDYSTVLLRAIGISDFAYRNADTKAVEAGFLSLERAAFPDLSRGDVVYMTYALKERDLIGY